MQTFARLARLSFATVLLAAGAFWLLGAHVPEADAILSMTSEAPFQVDPQPSPGAIAPRSPGAAAFGAPVEVVVVIVAIGMLGVAIAARGVATRRGDR